MARLRPVCPDWRTGQSVSLVASVCADIALHDGGAAGAKVVDVDTQPSVGASCDFESCEFAGIGEGVENIAFKSKDGARLACCKPLATKAVSPGFLGSGYENIPSAGGAWAHRRLIGGGSAGARLALHGNDSSTAARLSWGGGARWHGRLLL